MGFERKAMAFVEILRPTNVWIAFISVFLGAFLALGGIPPLDMGKLFYMAFSTVLILTAGNAINDYFDLEIDRINKPKRPLPSGKLKKGEVLFFAIALMCVGCVLGWLVNFYALALSVFALLTLIFYSVKLKATPLWGNLAVGLLTALTFIAGGIAIGALKGAIIPAIFAFFFTVSREIVKDIEDMEGDIRGGAITAPVKWGKAKASQVAFLFVILGVLFSPIPYIIHLYSKLYLFLVLAGVDLVLTFCMVSLSKDISNKKAARIQRVMKLDIFIGLAALYFGKI